LSSLDDSGAIFRYHRDMAKMHGKTSSLALGWRNNHDQQIRFEALSKIADLDGKTVLDAGCGYTDLLPYLSARYQLAHYCGIEQIPELLDQAIARYGHLPNTSFISGNFFDRQLPVYDYVFASGSLNYASSDPQFIFKAINKLYESCKLGLGFNLLKVALQDGLLVAYEAEEILAYCRALSADVHLSDGYADDDFTVWMYK
jgi:SAM-dependent methyltransferase